MTVVNTYIKSLNLDCSFTVDELAVYIVLVVGQNHLFLVEDTV